jgi:hypothetical protein
MYQGRLNALSKQQARQDYQSANFVYLKSKTFLSARETFLPKQSLKKQVQQSTWQGNIRL